LNEEDYFKIQNKYQEVDNVIIFFAA